MSATRVDLQPAFVVHTRPYRDTSLLVELFTKDHGCLTVISRGVRKQRSKLSGLLVPFLPLIVSFSGKGELQSLNQVEASGASYNLGGNMLLSSFYLNELLIKLMQRHDPHPNVFKVYQETLANLVDSKNLETELRFFEKALLVDLGYGLQLDHTVSGEAILPDEKYSFEFGFGLQKTIADNKNSFSGKSLLALHNDKLSTPEEFKDAKRLLRSVIAILLGNKTLKSRELFV